MTVVTGSPAGWSLLAIRADRCTPVLPQASVGVVAPLLVAAGWAALTATAVRRSSLGRHSWALAVAALMAPTVAFVAGKVH